MKSIIYSLVSATLLVGCVQTSQTQNGKPQWDFDHHVQFKETKLEDGKYNITVIPTSDTHFSTLSTFLLRRSYEICHTYGFTLEILKGIEGFDDRRAFPNLIMGSLAANLECPKK